MKWNVSKKEVRGIKWKSVFNYINNKVKGQKDAYYALKYYFLSMEKFN